MLIRLAAHQRCRVGSLSSIQSQAFGFSSSICKNAERGKAAEFGREDCAITGKTDGFFFPPLSLPKICARMSDSNLAILFPLFFPSRRKYRRTP